MKTTLLLVSFLFSFSLFANCLNVDGTYSVLERPASYCMGNIGEFSDEGGAINFFGKMFAANSDLTLNQTECVELSVASNGNKDMIMKKRDYVSEFKSDVLFKRVKFDLDPKNDEGPKQVDYYELKTNIYGELVYTIKKITLEERATHLWMTCFLPSVQ